MLALTRAHLPHQLLAKHVEQPELITLAEPLDSCLRHRQIL